MLLEYLLEQRDDVERVVACLTFAVEHTTTKDEALVYRAKLSVYQRWLDGINELLTRSCTTDPPIAA